MAIKVQLIGQKGLEQSLVNVYVKRSASMIAFLADA